MHTKDQKVNRNSERENKKVKMEKNCYYQRQGHKGYKITHTHTTSYQHKIPIVE